MGFFNQPTTTPNTTPADVARAQTLHSALMAHRRVVARANIGSWAIEFARLRRHRTDAEVDRTLAWYVANITGTYTPRVHSAGGFRKKYPAIEAAMARGTAPPVNPPGPLATRIAATKQCLWPGGAKEKAQELTFIQATIDFWVDLRRRVAAARDAVLNVPGPAGLRHRTYAHLHLRLTADINGVATGWLEEVHTLAWRRARTGRWAGNMGRYTPHINHWRIRDLLETELYAYCGPGVTLAQCLEDLNAH